ncbi:MAG: 1-deoxy-D-xylulose-5-phosphate synthase, partial [Candidatus Methylomirabilis sp.]|nr:1-deoxy-D-xylulose-5-phosphate synthase [Deltaproteobacteria bacterium]
DLFGAGHAGTRISAALGMNEAVHQRGGDEKTVAIIGDGSMTSGLAFEGLNQAGHIGRNLIVVLNDNEMGISPNVGALGSFLSRKLISRRALKVKSEVKALLKSLPAMGETVYHGLKKAEDAVVGFFTPGLMFEGFGFEYVGPIDGHDVLGLVKVLEDAKRVEHPLLIHAITKKGYGYPPAEADPLKYHGVGKFDPVTGELAKEKAGLPSYTAVFGEAICDLAEEDERIIAITAAMCPGTGLTAFSERFPKRFYDVGISEAHGVTFAAGMATEGYRPVCAIYSTFLQRAYDSIVHDVGIQGLHVVFSMDRGGIVGADGPTHQGLYDFAYMRHIPGVVVMAPKDENEMRRMLRTAIEHDGPISLRYPRGEGEGAALDKDIRALPIGVSELLREGADVALLGIGNTVYPCLRAAELLAKEGVRAAVLNARFVKPLDRAAILGLADRCGALVTVEEHVLQGGFGSAVAELLVDERRTTPLLRLGIPDVYVDQGPQPVMRKLYGLHPEGIAASALKLLRS